jgi:hypothetical protein
MTYANENAGRDDIGASIGGRDDFWTYEAVEERMIEAVRLWWRSPGDGRWPFAGDAPWHLMTRRTRMEASGLKGMDVQRMLQTIDQEETKRMEGAERRMPLTREDVARRDEATEWLGFVADRDRRLVTLALLQLAAGHKRVPWMKLKRVLGVEYGADGLRMRYSRAISSIAKQLNG